MGIFGTEYTSISDMFDGGGPGQSGATYDNDNDPNNEVTGIAAFSNTITGSSHANDGYGDENSAGKSANYSSTSNSSTTGSSNTSTKVKGTAPTNFFAGGIVGKLAGWANKLNPKEDKNQVIDGRAVYTSAAGMQYSYNFLGMPYEVQVQDGKVVDALSIKGDDGMTGYERMAGQARANGDDAGAAQIMEEAAANGADAESDAGELNIENITNMATAAGLISSGEEIKAMLEDPMGFFANKGVSVSDLVNNNVLIDPNAEGTGLVANDSVMLDGSNQIDTATVDNVEMISDLPTGQQNTYEASTTLDQLKNNPAATVDAAIGTVSDNAIIDPNSNQIDMVGAATGVNADGTVSLVGQALNDYASINTSNIIDTSTVQGKLLAQRLTEAGENYVDAKATILGQMEILSAEFKDANGNPIIPAWAQGLARSVNRSLAFDGMTGTASVAAMSNAIMEATLGIAEKEATFFQTLTIKNLDNRQEALINKMNVLSKFEVANLDARQAALVQNAKHFMEMDLANLDNQQQAEVLNTQAWIDSLFNDQAAINQARLFNAEQGNDMQMFYDEIVFQAQRYNTEMVNEMRRFNAGEVNDTRQFNATMLDSRERFDANMQYNIDVYNADWRQTVTETNAEMLYDAYAADVKNAADLNQEGLNRLWDRVDNMLDFFFKGAQTEAELDARVLMAEIQAATAGKGNSSGLWGALGSLGAAWITKYSDIRLKDNIEYKGAIGGIRTYTWDWNEEAKRIGADKLPTFGVIAQEVQKTNPEAVVVEDNGYLSVNYGKLQ